MGIFSQNIRPGLYGETVEAAYGYGKADAGAKIKLEGYQNDMALFTAIIESDFNSARAMHEGAVNEATLITEGTAANIFIKIKEFFKKLWEKLKGMIQSFMVKFVAVFIRDNKELVKKYHKQIVKQMSDSKRKYSEMEFKMTEGYYKYLTGEFKPEAIKVAGWADMFSPDDYAEPNKTLEQLKEKIDKDIIDMVNRDYKINISELNEFKKEMDDKYIGEKESYDGYTSSLNSMIETELTNGSKTIKVAETEKKNVDKEFKNFIKKTEEAQRNADKMDKGDEKDLMVKSANASYYEATQLQTAYSEAVSWKLSFLKGALKEIRGLYVKAVSRRATNESADILDDIIDEAVDYDVESMFEADVEADLNDDDLSAELDSIDQLSKDEKCGEGCRK